MQLVEEIMHPPAQYLKKLVNTDVFKLGVELCQMWQQNGLTQAELAAMLHTQKSAISRMKNHAEDIRLSTLFKSANLLGKHMQINFV